MRREREHFATGSWSRTGERANFSRGGTKDVDDGIYDGATIA